MVRKLLFETKVGDWLLWAFERLTGLVLATPDVFDYRVAATEEGRQTCTREP